MSYLFELPVQGLSISLHLGLMHGVLYTPHLLGLKKNLFIYFTIRDLSGMPFLEMPNLLPNLNASYIQM